MAFVVATVAFDGPEVVPIVNVVLKLHPLKSVTLTVCVPADKPLVKLDVTTPSTLKVKGNVPPVTPVMLYVPFDKPQPANVVVPVIAVGPAMLLIANVVVKTQPLKSVTFSVYVPAEAEIKVEEIPPLLQLYEYAGVPPLTVTVPEPLELPQVAGVNVDVKVNDVG